MFYLQHDRFTHKDFNNHYSKYTQVSRAIGCLPSLSSPRTLLTNTNNYYHVILSIKLLDWSFLKLRRELNLEEGPRTILQIVCNGHSKSVRTSGVKVTMDNNNEVFCIKDATSIQYGISVTASIISRYHSCWNTWRWICIRTQQLASLQVCVEHTPRLSLIQICSCLRLWFLQKHEERSLLSSSREKFEKCIQMCATLS